MIIPFNARFSPSDPDFDPDIEYKLRTDEAMSYLINLALAGLERVRVDKKFTTSEKIEKQLDEYEIENNPVLGFIRETDEGDIIHQPTADVYRRYQVYCQENGYQPLSNNVFSRQLNRQMHLKICFKRIDGKIFRIVERDV